MNVELVSAALPGVLRSKPALRKVWDVLLARPNVEVPFRTCTTTPCICGVGETPARGEGWPEDELFECEAAAGLLEVNWLALVGKAFLMRTTPTTRAATRMIALSVEVAMEK